MICCFDMGICWFFSLAILDRIVLIVWRGGNLVATCFGDLFG